MAPEFWFRLRLYRRSREGRKEGSRGCRSAGSEAIPQVFIQPPRDGRLSEGPNKGNVRAASLRARSSLRQTAIQSVDRIEFRIARSRLPIAVSVIVATTGTRIVAPAEWDADTDAKVRASPEASTVVIASAGVEPTRVVSAPSTVVSAAVVAAPAGIAAAHVRGGIAAPAGIGTARVGSGIAAPAAGIATARVRRGRIATSSAARERTAGKTAAGVPTASPAAALGQCGRRAQQHQDRAKSKRRHRGFERHCLHCPIHENLPILPAL